MYVQKLGKLIIVTDLKFNALFCKVSFVTEFTSIIIYHFSPLFKLVNMMKAKIKLEGKNTAYRFGKTLGYLNVHWCFNQT